MNVTDTAASAGQNAHANRNTSKSDKVANHIQDLFTKNGVSGKVELGRNADGQFSVLNDRSDKAAIEDMLNHDSKLASMLGRSSSEQASAEQGVTVGENGTHHANSDGDTVYISDVAQEAYVRHKSNYLGTTDAKTMTREEFLEYSLAHVDPALLEADRQADLQVNWKSFSNFGQNRDTMFDMGNTGSMVFEHSLGTHVPLRGLEREIAPRKSANIQEKEVMAAASASRKKAFDQLQTSMKRSGIELKQGQKVNFVMDEKGNIQLDPKSNTDKGVASKIEDMIKNDPKLNASIRDYLHVSLTSTHSTPASMRMHVDTVLKEYTGKGFDDLEWDSDGNLVIPEGFEDAVQDWGGTGGLTSMVGHLKSLQESEGDDIFKQEFSFTVTASGIKGDQMNSRAGSNLFKDDKMFDNKVYYTDEPMLDVNGNKTNFLKFEAPRENYQNEYWGMEAMKQLIQNKGTSVYLSADGNGDYAVDEKGNKQELPYKSGNYNATAKYLIEDYLIENGIEGDVSDYALKIDKKGSHEVVRLSNSKVK